jgi:hypothetical protein
MRYNDYVVKHDLADVWPQCKCGCGASVKFLCGKFMDYVGGHYHKGKKKSDECKRKLSEANQNRFVSEETKKKHSVATTRYHREHPEFTEATRIRMKNRIVSEETKQRMSVTRSLRIKSGEIKINKDKISSSIVDLYINNGLKWAKGSYESTKTKKINHYRSSWELQLMKELDVDADVVTWQHEPIVLNYNLSGNVKRYIPDFIVQRSSNTQLVEVKPNKLRSTPMNSAKRVAAIEYCVQKGWEYVEWEPGIINETTSMVSEIDG